jgi:hypothetical protein
MVGAILFGLLMLVMNVIVKLLPQVLREKYQSKKCSLNLIIYLGILGFFFSRVILRGFCIPGASGAVRLLGDISLLLFIIFSGWRLIKPNKTKSILAGGIIFILLIGLLSFVNSVVSGASGSVGANSTRSLQSLGYVDWVPAVESIEKTGVVRYDRQLAFEGLNLYSSWTLPEAYLIDMCGNIVHKWAKKIESLNSWAHHVELCEGGDVLVVAVDLMLVRLDWDSNVKWKKRMRVHHDACIDENQKIYVVAREDALVFWYWIPVPILGDYVAVLSPDGQLEKKIYIYDFVKERIPLCRIFRANIGILNPENLMKMFYRKALKNYMLDHGSYSDIMHTNSIEVIDRDIEGFCRKGDWLISLRQLDLIGIVDPEKKRFVWSWGPGELDMQHQPTLLKNGNILMFDNGYDKGFSRVIELNPSTRKIVWEYKSDPPQDFYSERRGGSQRLPNGNTLIAESDKGHVFEVTKNCKVVWDFYNPDVKPEQKTRGTIYRMARIIDSEEYNPEN